MTNKQQCEIGMIGLGVMGRNLLLNMADQGFSVAGFDLDPTKVAALSLEAKEHDVYAATNIKDFINSLRLPRAIMLLVPAGAAVDSVIHELLPLLQAGDLIIDAGNSYFEDTNTRAANLAAQNIQFLGVGISGGEEGARHGPSIMPGGTQEAYERVRPVLEAVAAKVQNTPCVTYLGPGSVGHYVKMVHNGIEYGIMQLIAETYDVMKRGLNLSDEQLSKLYSTWNQGELNGYLLEITGNIFGKKDDKTAKWLIDQIVAVAQQNGTGMWTSRSAMELQVPTPTIDMAVALRDLSVLVKERTQASVIYPSSSQQFTGDAEIFITQLHHALYAAIIITYAQGMALLAVASAKYNYNLELESVAKIWRGGCIIRAALLENICTAFRDKKDLPNLLLAPNIAKLLQESQKHLRQVVAQASVLELPLPGLMASLSYFDAYRSAWLPANLIQAQRDYFGSHTYERIDAKGMFHTEWEK
jgi:6-phosphogluconate dehydrogenase